MLDMAPEIARQIEQSPLAAIYPDVDWEVMMRKTGEMVQDRFDWSADVATITAPTLLIYADADMMYPEHIVEIYRLLGGGHAMPASMARCVPRPTSWRSSPTSRIATWC